MIFLLAAALVLLVPVMRRGSARRRLSRLWPVREQRSGHGYAARPEPAAGQRSRIAIAAAAGVAVAGLIGTWWGVPIAAVVGVGAEWFLQRREPAKARQERLTAAADLPLGADLLAAALRAGAPMDRAAAAVAEALGGPLGERLQRTARSLRLGADPDEAWVHLRADRKVAVEAAAQRAGVLIVLPLGLCFLPAFLLAGLVPVVVAVLGDVL